MEENSDDNSYRNLKQEYEKENINSDDIKKLVLSYFIHYGYKKTALAFMKQNGMNLDLNKNSREKLDDRSIINNSLFHSIDERKTSFELLISGKTMETMKYVKEKFNNVLEENDNIKYGLLSLHFIDLIRKNKRQEALMFAQREIASLAKKNSTFMDMLKDLLALLCYKEPEKSPVGYLMQNEYREEIAFNLNSAILESQKVPGISQIETAIAQLIVTQDVLYNESGKVCQYIHTNTI